MTENTQTAERMDIRITASSDEYNRSIDAAINKTVQFRKKQQELTAELVKNQEAQKRAAAEIESATQKYGANSQ